MSNLKGLLIELLGVLDLYKKDVQYFTLKNTAEDGLIGSGFTIDRNTHIGVTVLKPMTEIGSTVCFSNLPFLKSIIDSSYMQAEEARVEPSERLASDGATLFIERLLFQARRMKVSYQASDPLLAEVLQIAAKKPAERRDIVVFEVNKESCKEFEDAARIFAAYDNTKEDCRIEFSNGVVKAEFGERGRQYTEIIMASDLGADAASAVYLIDDVRRLLKLASINGGQLALRDKYLKLEFKQEFAQYKIIVSARTIRRQG